MNARYIQLSNKIIDDIAVGKLVVGQRMPSIRKMTRQHQVSITTILSCYHRLEEQGWLSAKPQSGFFVSQPLNKLAVPEYLSFKAKVTQPRKGKDVVHSPRNLGPLHTAQLSASLVPVAVLHRAQQRACQLAPEKIFQYPEVQGDQQLRSVLCAHFSQHYFPLCEDNLVITNGCIDAVRVALEVTSNKGDVIVVASPCFNGLLDLLHNMGRLVIEIPCLESGLDLEQLEGHLRENKVAACLLSASFSNPQGVSLSVTHKQRIVSLAEHYQVPIIEDDVYLELGFTKVAPLPIKHWDENGWVIWCGSISKTIGAGYRLGWCETGRYLHQYLNYLSGHSLGVNNIAQITVSEFIGSGQYVKYLNKLKLALASHALDYHQLLRQCLGEKAKISAIDGGLVLWVQIAGLCSQALVKKAAVAGIYIKAGSEFTSRDGYLDCFRLNIGWSISQNQQTPEIDVRGQLITLCELIDQCLISND